MPFLRDIWQTFKLFFDSPVDWAIWAAFAGWALRYRSVIARDLRFKIYYIGKKLRGR